MMPLLLIVCLLITVLVGFINKRRDPRNVSGIAIRTVGFMTQLGLSLSLISLGYMDFRIIAAMAQRNQSLYTFPFTRITLILLLIPAILLIVRAWTDHIRPASTAGSSLFILLFWIILYAVCLHFGLVFLCTVYRYGSSALVLMAILTFLSVFFYAYLIRQYRYAVRG